MGRVALFVTCVVDQVVPDAGIAAVRLLERAGCAVEMPEAQTCCGQPAANAGAPEAARRLAEHFLEVFAPYDAVVAPSGSCAATVRHWYEHLVDDRTRDRARDIAARTYELSQYLVDVLGQPDLGLDLHGETVTVHDACHGLRHLGLHDAARVLLARAGAEVIEMGEAETCCGFGGSFSLEYAPVATALADAKLGFAASTGARWLVSGDSACLLHLEGRRRRTGTGPQPVHLATLLARGLPSRTA